MNNWQQLRADYLWNSFTANFFHSNNGLLKVVAHSPLSFLLVFILIIFVILLVYILRFFFRLKKSVEEKQVLLEITPPSRTEKTAYTTTQLFSTFHGLINEQTLLDKLLGKKERLSFEIVSTKNEGIRYLLRTTPQQVNNIKKNLTTYLPDVTIKTIDDYLPKDFAKLSELKTQIVGYRPAKSFAFPLQKQNQLDEHDPVGYITGMMTKLDPGELISFQIVILPVKTSETQIIQNIIENKGDVLQYLNKPSYHWILRIIFGMVNLLTAIIKEIFGSLISVLNEAQSSPEQIRRMRSYEAESRMRIDNLKSIPKMLTPYEEELIQSIQAKISQPLFSASIRLLVIAKNKQELKERINGFKSSLSTFSSANRQSLKIKKSVLDIKRIRIWMFKNRLVSIRIPGNGKYAGVLSSSELSDLYHFPFTKVTRTENIVKTYSKELPAPLSLKKGNKYDVVFGTNNFGGTVTDIGLTEEERETHMYIIGRTGSGKTTMMFSMAKHDIEQGRGMAFLDPHGDAAEDLISIIPKDRLDDLVYINPIDLKYPIGINILELTPGLDEDEAELEKEVVCEGVISLFRKVFSKEESINAHRIEYILRNTIYTSFTIPDRTIFTVYDLLNNPPFQSQVVAKLNDENLKNFWRFEFGRAGDYQVVKMVGGVTAKIGRFLFSPTAKRILEQEKSTINFGKLMDEGKIIICNLSQGKLGEDTSRLLGTTVMTKIEQASLKRANIPESKRTPFYLYVDEFQNFATHSFTKMLSEGRKYKLRVTLAEQSTSQQDDKNIVNVILANVTTVVCFRTANYIDEELMLNQLAPYVSKGDIANLPRYNFYIKVSALDPEEPYSGETIYTPSKKDDKWMERLIEASRKNWAIKYQRPKEEVNQEGDGEEAKEGSDSTAGPLNPNGLPNKKRS